MQSIASPPQDQDAPQDMILLASARRASLQRDLDSLNHQRASIDREIRRTQDEIGYLEGILRLHGALDDGTTVAVPPLTEPRAANLSDLVVEIIKEEKRPLHFREIERQVRARGILTGGQDPANTLLAKYFNDSRLRRSARGTYELREWHPSAPSVGTRRAKKQGA